MTRRILLTLAAVVLLAGAACANDHDTTASAATPTTTAAASGAGGTAAWQRVVAPSDCMCSDASGFHFWIHRSNPRKVLFYLQGGGACFSADTCGPTDPSYTRNLTDNAKDEPGTPGSRASTGILDLTNRANPFRDYSIVFVPYCTGDLHLGNATHDYGGGVVVHHNGYINASTALAATAAAFPDAGNVVVAGGSAGSAGSPLYAGLAHDVFPDAKVTLIADGSGAYPSSPALTAVIGKLWGTTDAEPHWTADATTATLPWSLPGLFVHSGKHDPSLVLSSINTAYDETQTRFAKLVGLDSSNLLGLIDANTASIESGGVKVHSWVGPGRLHTILGRREFYTDTVNGTKVRDWVANLIAGKDAPDVHCTECGPK